MRPIILVLAFCASASTSAAGPVEVSLLVAHDWSPSGVVTAKGTRNRVGARVTMHLMPQVAIEALASLQPRTWLSSVPQSSDEPLVRYNHTSLGVDLRATPWRGSMSVAEEAVLPVRVSVLAGVRMVQQPARSTQPAVHGEIALVRPEAYALYGGPSLAGVFEVGLSQRLSLRTDVGVVGLVLPPNAQDPNVLTLWPNTSVSVAYRL